MLLLDKKVAHMGHAQNQSPILFTDIIHSLLLLPSPCRQTYTSGYSFGLGKNNYQNSRTALHSKKHLLKCTFSEILDWNWGNKKESNNWPHFFGIGLKK